MSAAYLFSEPTARPLTPSGAIMPGAKLTFYESGTTTPATVYADAALQTPLSNPVEADASGRFPPIYLDPLTTYRVLLHDADDVLIYDVDPYLAARDYPPGTVMWFHGTAQDRDVAYPPELWQVLNGENGTPDARDRYLRIAGGSLISGQTGGSLDAVNTSQAGGHDHGGQTGDHTLTIAEIPEHHHRLLGDSSQDTTATHGLNSPQTRSVAGRTAAVTTAYYEDAGATATQLVEDTGGGDPHAHSISSVPDHFHTVQLEPSYVALWALMRKSS